MRLRTILRIIQNNQKKNGMRELKQYMNLKLGFYKSV
jgi:hypothetical protein